MEYREELFLICRKLIDSIVPASTQARISTISQRCRRLVRNEYLTNRKNVF